MRRSKLSEKAERLIEKFEIASISYGKSHKSGNQLEMERLEGMVYLTRKRLSNHIEIMERAVKMAGKASQC